MSAPGPPEVRAGGGVVWRRTARGPEVLLVHRPRYDDWSLPKGKADPGESDERCALREVVEETGLYCELGPHLADVRYVDRRGRPKVARYWAMQPVRGRFEAGPEVDEVRWLPLDGARELLSYPHDAPVLDAFERSVA